MKAFAALNPRERHLVSIVLPLAIVVVGYQFLWAPLQRAQAEARADIQAFRLVQDTAALASVDTIVSLQPLNETPLATRITTSASAANLTLRRIEPENDSIRVTLDDTPFATILLWLSDLEEQHDVRVEALEVDRRPAPGRVSARLLLGSLQ
jgi:general secretion pathway protein M